MSIPNRPLGKSDAVVPSSFKFQIIIFQGNYERFSFSRVLAGIAPVVVYVATLIDPPSFDRLEKAIETLLVAYPLLQASIPTPHIRHPAYVHNPEITAHDILRRDKSGASHADLLDRELNEAKYFNIRTGPAWRVTFYDGTSPRVALAFIHTLCDGLGGRNLMGQLLQLITSDNEINVSLARASEFPPSLESTIDQGPPPSASDPPPPPASVTEAEIWPNPTPVIPFTRESRTSIVQIPAETVSKLKSTIIAHGVRTLHPLLHAVAVASLSAAVGGKPINALTSTPISLRNPSLGHPYATGNYVGGYSSTYFPLEPSREFWELVHTYAKGLSDPQTLEEAKRTFRFLLYLPDPDPSPAPDKTGWSLLMEEKMNMHSSYRGSLELSNVGVIEEDVPGVQDVAFVQAPNPLNVGLSLNVSPSLIVLKIHSY
jgi:hypothetical protein